MALDTKNKIVPNIEVSVKQRTLAVGKRKLRLEDNFEGAEVLIVSNRPGEYILELHYRKNEGFSEKEKGDGVYDFLRDLFEPKQIQVYSTRAADYSKDVFPAVEIVGKFNAVIYAK